MTVMNEGGKGEGGTILLLLQKPGSTCRRASKKSSVPIGGGVAGNWGSWWSEVSNYTGLRLRKGIPLACLGPVAQAQHVTQHPGPTLVGQHLLLSLSPLDDQRSRAKFFPPSIQLLRLDDDSWMVHSGSLHAN